MLVPTWQQRTTTICGAIGDMRAKEKVASFMFTVQTSTQSFSQKDLQRVTVKWEGAGSP